MAVDSVEELNESTLQFEHTETLITEENNKEALSGPVNDEVESVLDLNKELKSKKINKDDIGWKVGEEAFNSMFEAGTMSCHDEPHPQSLDGTNAILTDCICPPNCGGGGYDPGPGDPGDPFQFMVGSEIFEDPLFSRIYLGSYSQSSDFVGFIGVIGDSYRNGVHLIKMKDEHYNATNASTLIYLDNPLIGYYEQAGQHVFSDVDIPGTVIFLSGATHSI